ncbi:cytochrome P450 [Actinocorallia libanotica]
MAVKPAREARRIPVYRSIPRLSQNFLAEFERIGLAANCEVVRLDAKVLSPYLLVKPEHIQHVLKTNADNYIRESMFYTPLFRLFGNGILGESEEDWQLSRRTMQPMFTSRYIRSVTDRMITLINEGLDEAVEPARKGEPIDVATLMGSVVNKAIVGLVFGQRINPRQVAELAHASDVIVKAILPRLFTPFLPGWMPRPQDRAFAQAVKTFDDAMMPIARERAVQEQDDLLTVLLDREMPEGQEVPTSFLRDNFCGVYGAATETTSVALTWVWPTLADNPEVYERLVAEIEEVVGGGPLAAEHLPRLVYTRQVIDEMLRCMPVAWALTRGALEEDVIDGVRIEKGADIVISQYLTHRHPLIWDRPHEFDPDRFAPGRKPPHRYAYFPFGGGGHQCLGNHLFLAEATIAIASLLTRFRLVKATPSKVTPQLAASVRVKEKVQMILRPV